VGKLIMRVLVALALCVPLAGCFSLTGPKPLPEWAISPQADNLTEPKAERKAVSRAARRSTRAARSAERTDSISDAPTLTQPAALPRRPDAGQSRTSAPDFPAPIAFSPEWQAREDAADARLRRSMSICRGC
jgi:hypothetical protein